MARIPVCFTSSSETKFALARNVICFEVALSDLLHVVQFLRVFTECAAVL
jgi:hypothetical protein